MAWWSLAPESASERFPNATWLLLILTLYYLNLLHPSPIHQVIRSLCVIPIWLPSLNTTRSLRSPSSTCTATEIWPAKTPPIDESVKALPTLSTATEISQKLVTAWSDELQLQAAQMRRMRQVSNSRFIQRHDTSACWDRQKARNYREANFSNPSHGILI